jgi:hypothetical protein
MNAPRIDRPDMPDDYGVPDLADGALEWESVEARLRDSMHYWMSTTRPDGRPHVVPRWGAWLDGRLWYDGSPDTVHAKNLRSNPACTLHLESGAQAVILEGTGRRADPPGLEVGARIASELGRKYADHGYAPSASAWEGADAGGLLVFTPEKALAWFAFPSDVTRFRFG